MKSIFAKTRFFVALALFAIAILPVVSCQKVEEAPSTIVNDWMILKMGDSVPPFSMVYSFTQSGQFEAGFILDETLLAQLRNTFSDMTLSEEGQKMLESLSVGDMLVQVGGSYTAAFDESGTAGTVTVVLDPQKCIAQVDEEDSVETIPFHDLEEDSMIGVGYSQDDEGNRTDIDIEMKSASSLGVKIGKHYLLKTLADSIPKEWK